jgi:hypothetical protein
MEVRFRLSALPDQKCVAQISYEVILMAFSGSNERLARFRGMNMDSLWFVIWPVKFSLITAWPFVMKIIYPGLCDKYAILKHWLIMSTFPTVLAIAEK